MARPSDGNVALELLLAGNLRWTRGGLQPPAVSDPRRRPIAALVCCMEFGPTPELLFSQPIGSLFILQGAGIRPSPSIVGGLAYAIEQLAIQLVVIMAHTACGFVDHHHHAGCAAAAVRELEQCMGLANLIAEHDVSVVPLAYDSETKRVRFVC